MPLATVIYEDSKIGREYPLHHLVLRMVEDEINGQTWRLRKVVDDNPKKSIDKVLEDIRITSLVAGAGVLLALVDRDAVIRHVNQNARRDEARLSATATNEEWAAEVAGAKRKDRFARDFVLSEIAKAPMAAIRTCVRIKQPGLDALAKALAAIIPPEAIT